MLDKYINELCKILNIEIPKVSYDTSNFPTETMMAQVDSSANTIYIRECSKTNPDQLFSIAHELRHIWQLKNDEQLFFSNYQPIDIIGSVEKYNLQIAEVDANAFGAIVMTDFFRLKPQWNGLPETVVNEINKRIKYIEVTEFSQ